MRNIIRRKTTALLIGAGMAMMIFSGCNQEETEVVQPDAAQETEAPETTTQEAMTEAATAETAAEEETTASDETQLTAGTYPDGTSPVFSDTRVKLTIGGEEVIIRMYDNTAAEAFLERLPLEDLNFSDLSGIEKPVDQPDEPFSLGDETPGYDPVTGDMVIYRPWGNFTIFYGDFRHSDELVPLGQVERGLDIVAGQTEDFTGTMEK